MNKDTVYLAGWLLKRFPPLVEIPFAPETAIVFEGEVFTR